MRSFPLSLTLAFLASSTAFAQADLTPNKEVLIKFRGAIDAPLVKKHGGTIKRTLRQLNVVAATVPPAAIAKLAKARGVAYVEPNAVAHATKGKPSSGTPVTDPQTVPWGIAKIGAAGANTDGAGIVVAVLDSGIGPNQDVINGTIQLHPDSYDFVNGDADPTDDNGHGTHVAGTIAAINNSIGVVGVAPGATLMAVKVLNRRGSGSYGGIADGIMHAADKGAHIINMSLGGESDSQTLKAAVDYAVAKGVLVITSAGNDATSGNDIQYPAYYDNVLSVGATDSEDKIASFSSHGSWVDISAPGVGVLSTLPGDTMDSYNGTSMAAPHVAGAAAVLWAAEPTLTADEVGARLMATASDKGTAGWDEYFGHGRLDLARALAGVPDYDVAALSVTAPASLDINQKDVVVTVAVANVGKLDLNGVEVALYMNGQPVATSPAFTLPAGAGLDVPFTVPQMPGTPGEVLFEAVVTAPDELVEHDTNNGAESTSTLIDPNQVTKMHVGGIAYSLSGKNGRDLVIKVTILDAGKAAVSGATVAISLKLNGATYASGSTVTNSEGVASFRLRNAPSGTYTTDVTSVSKADAIWDSDDDVPGEPFPK